MHVHDECNVAGFVCDECDVAGFMSRAVLVPVFSFGENETYQQVMFSEGSWCRWAQCRLQKVLGFALCLIRGCRLLSADPWGLTPFPTPITSVGEMRLTSVHPSIHLSVSLCTSVYLSIYLSAFLSVHPSTYSSIYLHVYQSSKLHVVQ